MRYEGPWPSRPRVEEGAEQENVVVAVVRQKLASQARRRDVEHPWVRDLVVAVVYLALGFALYWPVWTTGPGSAMQQGGDQWRYVWFLGWTPWAIGHGLNPFFSGVANYPDGVNLLVNPGMPLLGVLFSPITVLFSPVVSYNLASTLALPLSALAAYVLLRRFTRWRPAAFLGGLLYGFSPWMIAQQSHLHLSFAAVIPLLFLALHEVVVRQRGPAWRAGIVLGLLAVAQFFIATELFVNAVLLGGVAVIATAVVGRRALRSHLGYGAKAFGWALATAGLVLAWPIWFFTSGPGRVVGPVQLVLQAYRADLAGVIVPDQNQLIAPSVWLSTSDKFANSVVENGSYLGIVLVVLLVAGLIWRRRHPVVIVALVTAFVAFVLSLGGALAIAAAPMLNRTGGAKGALPLPETLLEKVPLLGNLAPARFALLVVLMVAVAGGVLLDELYAGIETRLRRGHGWRSSARAAIVPGVVAALALVPLLPAGPVTGVAKNTTPSYFTTAARRLAPGTVAVIFPFPSGTYPQATLWQAEANYRFAMPGGAFFVPQGRRSRVAFSPLLGYARISVTASVFTDVSQDGYRPPHSPALREEILAEWRGWHVRTLLASVNATTARHPRATLQFLTWLAGRKPVVVGGVYLWRHVLAPTRPRVAHHDVTSREG